MIIGGNFAGLKAAMHLPARFQVTVVDPHPWFEFLPNIHEIVSGEKTPLSLRHASRKIVARHGHRFLNKQVQAILPEKNQIVLTSGLKRNYDFCLVAVGGTANLHAIPGADQYAADFKRADGIHTIRKKLNRLARSRNTFRIVIVGGGLEGMEALGEVLRGFRKHPGLQVHVVEKQAHILDQTPADIESVIRQHCRPYAVAWHTGAGIQKVTPRTVLLTGGRRLQSDLTIWTGGLKPNPLLFESGLTRSPDDWAPVTETLQHRVFPNILVAGDAAGAAGVNAKQAYHAIDMGRHAAETIVRIASGKPPAAFNPSVKPVLVSFGDLDTFFIAGKTVVAGTALSPLKEAVYQMVMTQFDPAGPLLKAFHLAQRTGKRTLTKGLTLSWNPSDLLRLKDVRLLPERPDKNRLK